MGLPAPSSRQESPSYSQSKMQWSSARAPLARWCQCHSQVAGDLSSLRPTARPCRIAVPNGISPRSRLLSPIS